MNISNKHTYIQGCIDFFSTLVASDDLLSVARSKLMGGSIRLTRYFIRGVLYMLTRYHETDGSEPLTRMNYFGWISQLSTVDDDGCIWAFNTLLAHGGMMLSGTFRMRG